MTDTFKCKCGNIITVPSQEAVSEVFKEMRFTGEIELKQNCDRCKKRQFTKYETETVVKLER